MSDIEGGEPVPPGPSQPGSGDSSSSNTSRSWLGSVLHRPRSAAPPPNTASEAGRFRRFSAVPEDKSTHHRAAGSGSTGHAAGQEQQQQQQQQQQGRLRKSTLQRSAEQLQQLYSSSNTSDCSRQQQQQQQQLGNSSAASDGGGGSWVKGIAGSGVSSSSVPAAGQATAAAGGKSSAMQASAMGDVMVGRMSMVVKVSEGAAKKYMHMVPEEEIEAQMESSRHLWSRGVIHPLDRRYRLWWYITVLAAAITGWLVPFRLAYSYAGYSNVTHEGSGLLDLILLAVFCSDVFISFFVGFYNKQGLLVMEHLPVAQHYLRHRFFLDILTTVPWDWVVLSATRTPAATVTGHYIALLSLLKLGRMYRLVVMFYNISYNLNVGLLTLTLLRNFTFCLFLLHTAACGFWYIALQQGGMNNLETWAGKKKEMLADNSTIELYIFSFYWALVTFATLGYGDVTPNTTPEVVYTICYVAINIVVWAYVLGTITLLVTKQDEELGVYRQRMQSLNTYCNANNIPRDLKQTMAGLLRLHMSLQNEVQGDEKVLEVFPTTVRRRILRQLYSHSLKSCYLFTDTGVKFLDALMLGSRVELFLPKVEIVSALDHANELYIVVAGFVEVVDPSQVKAAEASKAEEEHHLPLAYAPSEGAENAFTAGMLTPQQLQYAASLNQRPTDLLPTPSRLVTLHEHQKQQLQHLDGPNGTAAAPAAKHAPGGSGSAPGAAPAKSASKPSAASKLLGRLPGGQKLQHWVQHGPRDSWRAQQEQLQADKYELNQLPIKVLARASRSLGTTSSGGGGGGFGGKNDALRMPAYAMRNLTTSSRTLLQKSSGGSSFKGIGASSAGTQPAQDQVLTGGGAVGAGRTMLGAGDCFAEVAYFTEVPKAEAVRSLTVCKVLVIPRSTYNAVARDFPLSARQVLENLKRRAQELVEEFLPRELALELIKGPDGSQEDPQPHTTAAAAARGGSSGGSDPAAAAVAGGSAEQLSGGGSRRETPYHRRSPFSSSDIQAEAAVAAAAAVDAEQYQQQQHEAGVGSRHSPLGLASSTEGPSAAATAAAMRRLTPAAMAAAVGAANRSSSSSSRPSKERPLLSSMSVNLAGRYSAPGGPRSSAPGTAAAALQSRKSLDATSGSRLHSRSTEATVARRSAGPRSGDASEPTSPLSTSSLEFVTPDERQARALARFTASLQPRLSSKYPVQSDAELLSRAGDTHAAAMRSRTLQSPEALQQQRVLSLQQRTSRRGDDNTQRLLTTMSLLPQNTTNTDLARDWEGLPKQQQQQQQQPYLGSRSAEGAVGSSADAAGQERPHSAEVDQQQRQQQQERLRAALRRLGGGIGYEDTSRIYSEEEVQAVAAALPAPLTMQQQRMLADLLRLKRLVNKAAAKYDQVQLTSFLDAAATGDVDVVQDMLRQGMNPNTADYDGRTALMIAAYRGRKDVVLALLFAGADTTPKDARGFDVMIEAARGNREDVIDVLKRSGARTGISVMLQGALLCKATYEGKLDRLALLLRADCDASAHDYDGQTALHVAAAEGSIAAARVLVQSGASVTLKDRWGYSPLDVAHKVGSAPLVEYLTSQVAPEVAAAAAENWKRERTEAALAAARYGDTAALARLLDRGCPVDAADYDGRSLLHVAVHNKQEAVVKQLLAAGADPNVRGSSGSSPLLEAAMDGSTAVQSELMSAGARLNLPETEEAALLSSVLHAHRHDQLLALLTAGADPAAADYDSRTPLHIAASLGDVGALQLMADALADSGIERLTSVNWQAKDRWGDTPLQEAQRAGHKEAAALLQQQIAMQQQRQQQQQQLKR